MGRMSRSVSRLKNRQGADGYDFAPADAFVNFGVSNNLYLVGHTLVWHGQTPNWVSRGLARNRRPPRRRPDPARRALAGVAAVVLPARSVIEWVSPRSVPSISTENKF